MLQRTSMLHAKWHAIRECKTIMKMIDRGIYQCTCGDQYTTFDACVECQQSHEPEWHIDHRVVKAKITDKPAPKEPEPEVTE